MKYNSARSSIWFINCCESCNFLFNIVSTELIWTRESKSCILFINSLISYLTHMCSKIVLILVFKQRKYKKVKCISLYCNFWKNQQKEFSVLFLYGSFEYFIKYYWHNNCKNVQLYKPPKRAFYHFALFAVFKSSCLSLFFYDFG